MRSDLFRKWLVLVVCACGVAAAGELADPVAEANEPWIAAEHLAPGWESMTLSTQLFNHEIPATRPMVPRRSLSFGGRIEVVDPNGLIGLSLLAKNAKAFDEIGTRIQVDNPSTLPVPGSLGPFYGSQGPSYEPLELEYSATLDAGAGQRAIKPKYFSFTIDMSMGYNASFPVALSRLEWSMSALLSDHIQAVDIPFAITADWTEVMPGLEVLVEKAAVEQGKYSYQMKARHDPNKVTYLDAIDAPPCFTGSAADVPYSWPVRAYPEMIVTALDVVDAEGRSVFAQSLGRLILVDGRGFHDSDGQRIVTCYPRGTCSECGRAAFIRHTIAFKPYNQELQFVLENVPVPTE